MGSSPTAQTTYDRYDSDNLRAAGAIGRLSSLKRRWVQVRILPGSHIVTASPALRVSVRFPPTGKLAAQEQHEVTGQQTPRRAAGAH